MQEKSGVDMADSSKHFDDEKHSFQSENDDEIFESDIELDDTDAVEPDNDPPQKVSGRRRVYGDCFKLIMFILVGYKNQ